MKFDWPSCLQAAFRLTFSTPRRFAARGLRKRIYVRGVLGMMGARGATRASSHGGVNRMNMASIPQPCKGGRGRKWILVASILGLATAVSAAMIPNLFPFFDPTGVMATYNVNGPTDTSNPFFQTLGTNGRSCATCHIAGNAFGLSVQHVQTRFLATRGHDPLFADVDGANCPGAAADDPSAHSLLLEHGLIRVAITLPAGAQFQISAARDPYGCGVVTDPVSGLQTVSVYRRPLPSTNLGFLSAVMFDGRETVAPLNVPKTFQANLVTDLKHQAVDATLGHAQATAAPTADQQTAIVNFELGLFSAQVFDNRAGLLNAAGAQGGPLSLSKQTYYPGINDSLGKDPNGAAFNPAAFTLFAPWANLIVDSDDSDSIAAARKAIAAGENIFDSHPLTITTVRGLNDNTALGNPPPGSIMGTCTTCHDAPNVGDHSLPLPLDIGTGHDLTNETDPQISSGLAQLNFPGVPVYRITGCPNPFPSPEDSGQPYVIYTTDPGKALLTGLCSDVNRIKGPILRGLAARAPYFHNGAAQDLNQVVNFYNQRFQMNLSDQEKRQLVAFLNSL
jgi:cytochrome c peroxidase